MLNEFSEMEISDVSGREFTLRNAVRKSLGYNYEELEKNSIRPCAGNMFLDKEFDPFLFLELTMKLGVNFDNSGLGE